jgi:hypothetical protein
LEKNFRHKAISANVRPAVNPQFKNFRGRNGAGLYANFIHCHEFKLATVSAMRVKLLMSFGRLPGAGAVFSRESFLRPGGPRRRRPAGCGDDPSGRRSSRALGGLVDEIQTGLAIEAAENAVGELQDIEVFDDGTGIELTEGEFHGLRRAQVTGTHGSGEDQDFLDMAWFWKFRDVTDAGFSVSKESEPRWRFYANQPIVANDSACKFVKFAGRFWGVSWLKPLTG